MIKNMPSGGLFVIGLLALTITSFAPAFVSTLSAHKGASGVVKERMDAMQEMKGGLKLIEQMLEGKKPYKSAEVLKALKLIRGHAGSSMSDLFPEGTASKPSEADPDIWKNWDEFKKMAVSLNHSTDQFKARLPAKTDKKSLKSLQKDALVIRKTCKTCHDRFRL